MISETKISKGFQTIIPSKIRKELDVNDGDHIRWKLVGKELTVEFIKDVTFEDVYGMIKDEDPLDAVEIKKRIQRGEKY